MVTNLKGMAIWEALRGLKGLFSGSDSSQDSIKQEVASVLDRTSDEVILLPADAAIMAAKGPDGRKYLDAFQNILLSLKPHQREQWRRIVAKHVLTEKHEQVVTSRKTIKTGGKAAARETDKESPSLRRRDSGQQQNVSAREEISETFDRREVDYEWTAHDPRVKHYLLVIDLYFQSRNASSKTDEKEKEEEALSVVSRYLLAKGLITEKSVMELGEEKLVKVKDAAVSTAYANAAQLIIGTDEYDRIMSSTREGDARNQALDTAIKAANDSRRRKLGKSKVFTKKRFCYIALALVGIAILIRTTADI